MAILNPVIDEPTERTTRMKPSEALRLGRLQFPDVTHLWVTPQLDILGRAQPDTAFCAVGLINYMRGDSVNRTDTLDTGYYKSPCACSNRPESFHLGMVIMHLSDLHCSRAWADSTAERWTQDQIAAWLESIDQ